MVTLREHQIAMLQLLNEVDRICKKHQLHYMLFAGTLLGAVRHQGFIPWDDDMDVIMLRSEYNRFLTIAAEELDFNQFYLQGEYSEHWPMFFSKLRLQNTAAIEKYHPNDKQVHQGIYIDIFPCDNLSDYPSVRKLQFAASKVVIAKSLYNRGYETNSLKKKFFLQFCRLLPLSPFLTLTKLQGHENTQMVHCFLGAASKYQKSIFPRKWATELIPAKFEGKEYPISAHYDALLSRLYGDYMTLPTKEERRCKVHAVIVDTQHSYQEYLNQQDDLRITSYTRSIR